MPRFRYISGRRSLPSSTTQRSTEKFMQAALRTRRVSREKSMSSIRLFIQTWIFKRVFGTSAGQHDRCHSSLGEQISSASGEASSRSPEVSSGQHATSQDVQKSGHQFESQYSPQHTGFVMRTHRWSWTATWISRNAQAVRFQWLGKSIPSEDGWSFIANALPSQVAKSFSQEDLKSIQLSISTLKMRCQITQST